MSQLLRTSFFLLLFTCAVGCQREPTEREERISAGGVELYCRIIGQGEPLLILPGGPGLGHDYFLPAFKRLATKYQVIFLDQRGHGRSALQDYSYETVNFANFVADVEAVREQLGLERMTLVGHSAGAYTAIMYAGRYPKRLQRLVLLNPPGATSEALAELGALYAEATEPFADKMASMMADPGFLQGDPELLERFSLLTQSVYFCDPKKVNELYVKFTPQSGYGFVQVMAAMYAGDLIQPFNLFPTLGNVQCPTLVLHSACDLIPEKVARAMVEALPHGQWAVVPDAGHYPWVEKPDAFFPLLEGFLEGKPEHSS